jgi:hypothetical protein
LFVYFGGTFVFNSGLFVKQILYCLCHTSSPFCSDYFGDGGGGGGVLQTICLVCPPTVILLIAALQVARTTGMNHGAQLLKFFNYLNT